MYVLFKLYTYGPGFLKKKKNERINGCKIWLSDVRWEESAWDNSFMEGIMEIDLVLDMSSMQELIGNT